jgi:hypothetical protein
LWQNVGDVTHWGFHQGLLLLFFLVGAAFFCRRWTGTVIVALLINLAVTLYLFYIGRAIYRATYLMDLSAIIMLFYASETVWLKDRKKRFTTFLYRRKNIVLYIGILFIALFTTTSMIRSTGNEVVSAEADELYRHIQNHPESFFVFDSNTQGFYLDNITAYAKPLKPMPPEYERNVSAFGGWHILSPSYRDGLQSHGLGNVYADIIDNPNVYVVSLTSTGPELILQYLNDHYALPGKEIYDAKEIYYGSAGESGAAGSPDSQSEFANGEIEIWQVKTRPL